ILDEHVGAGSQAVQHLATAIVAEVDADGPLAAIERREAGRSIARGPDAERVARTGWLDLDHISPERGQQHAGVRSGDEGGDLDHAHAGKWRSHPAHHDWFCMLTDDTLCAPEGRLKVAPSAIDCHVPPWDEVSVQHVGGGRLEVLASYFGREIKPISLDELADAYRAR